MVRWRSQRSGVNHNLDEDADGSDPLSTDSHTSHLLTLNGID